jgi:hypothetical protein
MEPPKGIPFAFQIDYTRICPAAFSPAHNGWFNTILAPYSQALLRLSELCHVISKM